MLSPSAQATWTSSRRGSPHEHARGRGARLPAGPPHDDPHRRAGATASPASGREAALAELLGWADAEGVEVGVVGSGSNLLVADAGFRGLVIKLDGALATIEQDGQRLLCGGGARLPQAAALAARAGLSGLEFGVNIPGTVGGAVKMNANAYGGDLARVLEWVDVATPSGTDRREPSDARLRVPQVEPRARRGRRARVLRAHGRRAERGEGDARRACAPRRREAQPSGIKTFGSTFKNPDDPRAEGKQRRRAARRGRLPRPDGRAARASRRSTRTSWRTWARPPPRT